MDTGSFHANLMGPASTMYPASKASAEDDMSLPSAGLARYHSAPSSTFSALLEQDFYTPSDGAELVQFLSHSSLSEYGSYADAGLSLKPNQEQSRCRKEIPQQNYPNQNDTSGRHGGHVSTSFQEHIGQGSLSVILEHSGEEALIPQPNQQSSRENNLRKPRLASSVHFKSNLIRHSSLPTDFLSRLAMEDMSENPAAPQQIDVQVQNTSPRHSDSTGGKVYVLTSNLSPRGVPVRKCLGDTVDSCKGEEYSTLNEEAKQYDLLRQSSSPAGLLSQLTLDDFSPGSEKVAMSSAHGLIHGHAMGGWDEAAMDSAMEKIAALGQRKRGREADVRLFKGLPASDILMAALEQGSCPPVNHYPGTSNGDSLVADSVLCRSRAKRGCATHPRSIAERVRRTKISERMKKLQDLVPNLDKQAHTADMLDEVVEYVKLLQSQVQELLKHSNECNGMCQKKGSNANDK